MKKLRIPLLSLILLPSFISCGHIDDFIGDGGGGDDDSPIEMNTVDFKFLNSFQVGGEGAAEISAFDAYSQRLFVTNAESGAISVYDLSNVGSPVYVGDIVRDHVDPPNSVSAHNGLVVGAFENKDNFKEGYVKFFDSMTLEEVAYAKVGVLPDMVTFTPDGKYVVVANEGEPNDDYSVDPVGSISIVNVETLASYTLGFEAFNGQEESLEAQGLRVFGPHANLAMDLEPEYVAVSDDSKTAWVTLQENNGVAVVNLETKQIESILPLGFKDHSQPGNEMDPSNEDGKLELRSVPTFGMYQPDAIAYYTVNGMDYIVTANEGDAREYEGHPGFIEEERIKDIVLDPSVFPDYETLQAEENLGRLKITTTLGDIDHDGDFDELYSYGARSFTIWSGMGQLLYDSGNDIAMKTLDLTPEAFNGGIDDVDDRSDDKGAEPEAVTILNMNDERQVLFVGLERNNQIMVYDITNPSSPEFIQILSNTGDVGPEGLLVVDAADSPTGETLLIVSNEVSGTVTIYEN
ncbi:MAG: choice-of-anchor I family protein [Bacteroidota bacterium]